jgi:hypothetical protein
MDGRAAVRVERRAGIGDHSSGGACRAAGPKETATVTELPQVREAFGFRRTECDCAFCKVYCRHLPGALDPSDLARLCPPGQEVFTWAEEHLRAVCDKPYPTLVPARREDGACHWYFDGRCVVHDQAPYSCAFFDAHMPPAEVARREAVTIRAIQQDVAADGVYGRVWRHLRKKGLVARPGDRSAVAREMQQIRRRAAALRRRAQGSASD